MDRRQEVDLEMPEIEVDVAVGGEAIEITTVGFERLQARTVSHNCAPS
jgi:hypothetical protein